NCEHVVEIAFGTQTNQSDLWFVYAQVEQSVVQFAIGLQGPERIAELFNFLGRLRQLGLWTANGQIDVALVAMEFQRDVLVFALICRGGARAPPSFRALARDR